MTKIIGNVVGIPSPNSTGGGGTGGAVSSVNGKTGVVVLSAKDVGAQTKNDVENLINSSHSAMVFPRLAEIEENLESKASKDEVNSKLSSVYRYKGTVDGYPLLPTNAEVGDVYNIKNSSGERYYDEPLVYPEWTLEDGVIPPFSEAGLTGFYLSIYFENKPSFMNGDKLKIGIYAPSYGSDMSSFEVPILDACPYPATSCAYWQNVGDNSGYVYIFVVYSEAPFNNNGTMLYDHLKNHPWNSSEKPQLHFNDEKKYTYTEPYVVIAGANVAWTGAEWDVLAGTVDMSNYYTKEQADVAFTDSTEVDNQIDAKITALDLVNTYQAKGDYATAEQGSKADTALQEITTTENSGLKITNKNQIDIDENIVFVFDCGDSGVTA